MTNPLRARHLIVKLAGGCILILLLVLAHIWGLIDFVIIFHTFVSRPQIVLECFIFITLSYFVAALRLKVLLKQINIPISFSDSFRITMISQFSGTILAGPIGAEITRFGMLVKKSGNRYTELTSVLLFDRVLGLSGLMIFVLFMSFIVARVSAGALYLYYLIAAFLLVSVALMMLFAIHKHLPTKKKQATKEFIRSCTPCLYKILSQLGLIFRTFKNILSNPLTLFKLLGFSVLSSILPLLGFSEIIKVFLKNVFDFPSSIMILAITILINSVGITPGGAGVGEGVFALLCFSVTGITSLPYIETFFTVRLISIMCVLPGGLFLLQMPLPKKTTS